MKLNALPPRESIGPHTFLRLNEKGQFVDARPDGKRIVIPPEPDRIAEFLDLKLMLLPEVSDVFIWVHGWRNDESKAKKGGCRLFGGIQDAIPMGTASENYPLLGHWLWHIGKSQ